MKTTVTTAGLWVALLTSGFAVPALGDTTQPIAVHYWIPVEAPTGDVQVMSLGLAEFPSGGWLRRDRFVHLRLAVQNHKDQTAWTVDARDQRLLLPDGRPLPARFAEASTGIEPAVIVLQPGQRGYLDLFFPIDGRDPDVTTLAWVVRRGAVATVASTAFLRLSDGDSDYEYFGPYRHHGGSMVVGSWCPPHWSHGWGYRYAPYGGYRHHRRRTGVEVNHGGRGWHSDEPAPGRETVGTRWRRLEPAPTRYPQRDAEPRPTRDRSDDVGSSVGRGWRASSGGSSSSSSAQQTESSSGSGSAPAPSSSAPAPSTAGQSVGSRWRDAR